MFTDTGKHHADDTSSSSCCAETMTTTIKREAHTPTTDQSEDSGVDVSVAAAFGNDGHGPCKRKRSDDEYDDGCPTPSKSNRTGAPATVLSVNMAVVAGGEATTTGSVVGCPPFRPWSSNESSTDVGLRLFHDIRNVDRILTLTQRHKTPPVPPPPPAESQPLDLTNGPRLRAVPVAHVAACARPTVDFATVTGARHDPTSVATTDAAVDTTTVTAVTRYSKNMSRARRIEANARERSRVHTISAAFDTLRTTIPSYSKNQKLSKLSTIRIASAYILTLSRLLDMDYSAEQNKPSVDECVNNVTGIIHMEGKARKKKDEQ